MNEEIKKEEDSSDKNKPMSSMTFMGVIMGLGWLLVASVIGSFFIGYWIDRWLGSSPWFAVGLSLLGTVAGTYKVITDVIRLGKRF